VISDSRVWFIVSKLHAAEWKSVDKIVSMGMFGWVILENIKIDLYR
jgi:hypothetical protein